MCAHQYVDRNRSSTGDHREVVTKLLKARPKNTAAKGFGPRGALARLHMAVRSDKEKDAWVQEARVDAIVGSCARSLPSVKSGILCYTAFIGCVITCTVAVCFLHARHVQMPLEERKGIIFLPTLQRSSLGLPSFAQRGLGPIILDILKQHVFLLG